MQKLTSDVVTQLNNLPGFPAIPNTAPPTSERWILGDWLVECRVNPEVPNAASLPLTDNRIGDVRVSLADQLWFIWDGAAWQSMAGGGGAVAAVTASAPLASSGGVNPNISFPTWPANAAGSLSNDGAGNLSWSAAGGITGSGTGAAASGYLTLWNSTSTVTGVNDGTNQGLVWVLNNAAWNSIGVRGWNPFDANAANQVRVEAPGAGYPAADLYTAHVIFARNSTSYRQGLQFITPTGFPSSDAYNWFFGQVADAGGTRADGGKVVLYAGDNTGVRPDGTRVFFTARQSAVLTPGEVIVNENQQDHDFRVAGVADANTLFVDGSASNVGVGESAPVNKLTVAGSFGPEIDTTAVSPTTLDGTHYTMLCDTSGGAITVNLPAASTCARRVYVVKNINVNAVTVQANGAETIDGANTYPLVAQWSHVMIQSDGSAWFVIG